jgi:hypothetical protein
MSDAVRYLLVTLWILGGAYIGSAGWLAQKADQAVLRENQSPSVGYLEYRGLSFKDERNLHAFLSEQESARFAPWVFAVPGALTPLLCAIGFGLSGGAFRLLKRIALDRKKVQWAGVLVEPTFGAVVGMMIMLLALTIPAIVATGETEARPEALAGLSLLGGIFSERAYAWLERGAAKLFVISSKQGQMEAYEEGSPALALGRGSFHPDRCCRRYLSETEFAQRRGEWPSLHQDRRPRLAGRGHRFENREDHPRFQGWRQS